MLRNDSLYCRHFINFLLLFFILFLILPQIGFAQYAFWGQQLNSFYPNPYMYSRNYGMYSGNYFSQLGQQVPFAPYWRSFQNEGQKAPEDTKGFPYTIYVGDNPPPYALTPSTVTLPYSYTFYHPYNGTSTTHFSRYPFTSSPRNPFRRALAYPGEKINMTNPDDIPPGTTLIHFN